MLFSYVLPITTECPASRELDPYLARIGALAELLVVDGSPEPVFADHQRRWERFARHLRPEESTLMGKVGNVMAGLRAATHERVVIADDDVRLGPEIDELVARLDSADVVRPQNYFDPLPWHAAWDSGRSLINRVTGGDWPGVLALRRSVLLEAGGYAGDVMFENFELCRTIESAGGRHALADDVFVRRLPPTMRHFWSQRVRQAYDELARPLRLVVFLPVAPLAFLLALHAKWRLLGRGATAGAVAVVAAAEAGRRRHGAQRYFPLRCSLLAPAWCAERAVCVWLALAARLRGGICYRGHRIRRAALGERERRRRMALSPAQVE